MFLTHCIVNMVSVVITWIADSRQSILFIHETGHYIPSQVLYKGDTLIRFTYLALYLGFMDVPQCGAKYTLSEFRPLNETYFLTYK